MPTFHYRALACAVLVTAAVTWLYAHEGHVALPSRGAQVDAVKGFIVLSRESRDALDVKAAEITTRPIPDSVLAYATLVAPWQRHAFATSRLPGRIVRMHARPGEKVAAGQTVAEIVSFELENLHLEIISAHTEQKLAEQSLAILRESGGSVPRQTVLDADAKRLQTVNALAVARAKWLGLGLEATDFDAVVRDPNHRVASYPIRSPVAGTVVHADLSVGKVIESNEHLFEVVDLTTVWARIGVLEKDYQRVAPGQPVAVRLSALPGAVFAGTVQVVNPGLDPVSHLNSVWVELTNPPGVEPTLLPGMTGQARIQMPVPADARVVPAAALIDDGLAQYILVEEAKADKQSEYRRKNVVVVRATADRVEVRAPSLFPGDRVVTQGAHELGGFFVPGVLKLSPEAATTIGLQVAPVARHPVADVIEVEGQVDVLPDRRSVASTPLAGNIVTILVDRGQAVTAGQVLAEVFSLEAMNLQLELIREQLALDLLEQQNKAYQTAGDAVPRRKLVELAAERNAVRFRRDSVRNRLAVAGLTPEQIDAMVSARRPLDRVPVRSPIAGTITSFDKALGQSVKAETPLFEVQDLSRPAVQGFVSERDARRIAVGQAARVRLTADSRTTMEGRVVRSSRVVSPDDQTLRIWVDLPQPTPAMLRDGQLAGIAIVAASSPPTLAVPHTAILHEGTRAYVFVRSADGAFDRRPVTTGRADDQWTEVTAGLAEAEVIAVRGVNGLQTAYASLR
ncbi:MAG: efflux RND transporter periplasmic adaptor subunit [Gemmataceae bacterium]|nr:efflux RND transporter periplasmic adaptor subunit [Gemmataceae bacterium]